MSLSSRRAWIEIVNVIADDLMIPGRSPHGGRGLKSQPNRIPVRSRRRSPHGERGLKFRDLGL